MAQDDRPPILYAMLSLLLIVIWIVTYSTHTLPTPISLFCGVVGLSMQYIYGIRTGELGARFFFPNSPFKITRAQSPIFFFGAIFVEGMWILVLSVAAIVFLSEGPNS